LSTMNKYGDPAYWDCSKCGAENSVVHHTTCQFCGHEYRPLVVPAPTSQPEIARREDRPRGVSRDAQHIGDLLAQQSLSSDGIAGWLRVQSVNRPKTAGRFMMTATIVIAIGTLLLSLEAGPGAIFLGVIFWFYLLFVPKRDR
jgi:hypothetical protein